MADENQVFKRIEDFTSLYANNVQFEASAWDLKVIFGELDQSHSPLVIEQHTSVTIPWSQVKIAAYFLIVNIIVNQSHNGAINVPTAVVPGRPNPSDADLDEPGRKAIAYLAWVHDQFFGQNPYLPPEVTEASSATAGPPQNPDERIGDRLNAVLSASE